MSQDVGSSGAIADCAVAAPWSVHRGGVGGGLWHPRQRGVGTFAIDAALWFPGK